MSSAPMCTACREFCAGADGFCSTCTQAGGSSASVQSTEGQAQATGEEAGNSSDGALTWPCPGCTMLTALHLDVCPGCFSPRPASIAPPGASLVIASIAAAATDSGSLSLRRMPFDAVSMEALCAALDGKCGGLRDVVINHCGMDDNLASQLAERVLSQCTSLVSLDVAYNGWGDAGLISICAALSASSAPIKELYASHGRGVSPAGAAAVATLLGSETTCLKTVQLDECKIGDEGACILAAVLANNRCAVTLDLVAVGLTQVGADALLQAVQTSGTVQQLNLAGNDVHPDYNNTLQQALDKNKAEGSAGARVNE